MTMAKVSGARVSIIVEWENALNAEASRSVSMLETLFRQATQLSPAHGPFELLLVFDAGEFPQPELAELLTSIAGHPQGDLPWQLLPSEQAGYYQNKNQGARAASGDLLIFLDSDVIPEPDWLARMLGLAEPEKIRIGVGNAYIEAIGMVGKTFAMTWFFPLRAEDGPPQQVTSFFANNLIIDRRLYQDFPFPERPGAARGGCIYLAQQLEQAGIAVYMNPMARVSHPAPNGWEHFCNRALAQGRDRLAREKSAGCIWSGSWPGSCTRLLRHWGQCWHNIVTKHRKVDLGALAIPAAGLIACTYYFIYFCGETASHIGLKFIQRVRV